MHVLYKHTSGCSYFITKCKINLMLARTNFFFFSPVRDIRLIFLPSECGQLMSLTLKRRLVQLPVVGSTYTNTAKCGNLKCTRNPQVKIINTSK